MQTNWNTLYNSEKYVLQNLDRIKGSNDTQTEVAYWQWADSYMTSSGLIKHEKHDPSVAYSFKDTVSGYLEYSYWLNYYCDPTNDESEKAMSSANW